MKTFLWLRFQESIYLIQWKFMFVIKSGSDLLVTISSSEISSFSLTVVLNTYKNVSVYSYINCMNIYKRNYLLLFKTIEWKTFVPWRSDIAIRGCSELSMYISDCTYYFDKTTLSPAYLVYFYHLLFWCIFRRICRAARHKYSK